MTTKLQNSIYSLFPLDTVAFLQNISEKRKHNKPINENVTYEPTSNIYNKKQRKSREFVIINGQI